MPTPRFDGIGDAAEAVQSCSGEGSLRDAEGADVDADEGVGVEVEAAPPDPHAAVAVTEEVGVNAAAAAENDADGPSLLGLLLLPLSYEKGFFGGGGVDSATATSGQDVP